MWRMIIFMNDKFERRGQLMSLSDSLIMLIKIVDRSSKKFAFVHHLCVYTELAGRERRHTGSLTHDNKTCIPRQIFVLKFNMH